MFAFSFKLHLKEATHSSFKKIMIEFSKKVGRQVEFNALIEKIYPKIKCLWPYIT